MIYDYRTARAAWNERAMNALLPEGAPWNFDKFREHLKNLSFDETARLADDLSKFGAKEDADKRAAEAAHQARMRSDPLYGAQADLQVAEARAEREHSNVHERRQHLNAQLSEIARLEVRRREAKEYPPDWLELSEKLRLAQVERERLALLLSDAEKLAADWDQSVERSRAKVDAARAAAASAASAAE